MLFVIVKAIWWNYCRVTPYHQIEWKKKRLLMIEFANNNVVFICR